ncbi:MAG: 50S ribosomal protein L6 [Planctomycetes bacterium]|nr:50S ribosomal protein L6 [Planctomycetota bacterium]
MSRIGKAVITVPNAVQVTISPEEVSVTSKGVQLKCPIPEQISVDWDSGKSEIRVKRQGDDARSRALHGLTRALIANMVRGVVQPWEKKLEIVGVGYQASLAKDVLTLNVGFANPVVLTIPPSVKCTVPDPTHIVLSSPDKHLVGQTAAEIRAVRPPEPYKGKGVRYADEHVKRKSGKAFGS